MKKYSWSSSCVPKKELLKIILCMKLTIFLMVAFCLQLTANVHSQSITMQMQNASLKKIFLEIEKKSTYSVIFNDDAIPKGKLFSVNVTNEDVRDVLTDLLSTTTLTYKIQNTLLVITSKSAMPARPVTGRVTDENNQPLIGVSVSVKGTTLGTATDENGNYRISVDDDNGVLVFRYIGFKSIERSTGSNSVLNVTMSEDNEALNEVVVIGYGGVRKSDLTGSVVSVKSKELTAFPSSGVQQALQGRAAGVLVQANNGNPGGSYKIRIRGGTSVNASSDPLFVVDGFAGGILPPPEDIESMEILKDASATAIYGSRGANGVILISTKRGKSGKTLIDFNSSYSGQKEINRLPLLNGSQFADYIKEINPAYVSANQNTDWQDLIFRQGDIKNTQLSLSGGTDAIRYYVSGALYDQNGIIHNSSFKRFSVTSNLDFSATKWLKIGLNLFARSSENIGVRTQENSGGSTGTGVVSGAFKFGPDQPVLRPDGTYSIALIGDPHDNPVAVVNELESEDKGSLYQYNFYADFDLVKNLKFKTTFGAFSNNQRIGLFTPTTLNGGRNVGGDASVDSELRNSFINENFITYTNKFAEKHAISILGGFSYQKFINEESGARSQSFLSNSVSFRNLGGGAVFLAGNSALSESQLASYYGRFNYNFSDRYLLTVNTRYDGSSNFSKNNKWAFFPSAALAWNMHNEKFMQNIPLINSFKWRISYGLTGNQAISPYQTLARFSSVFTIVNGSPVNAVRPTTIANDDLKWETTAQQNYGVDIGFLKNRLNFTADYYKSITSDLLFSVPLPQYSGYSTQTQNIGKIQNKGLEFSLGSKNIVGKFNWSTDFNISFNRNKVLELPRGNDIIYAIAPGHMIGIGGTAQVLRVGQPVGSFFGWIYDGVYQTGATFKPGGGFEQAAGGENFRDLGGKKDANGKALNEPDGLLNNDDRTIIGNPNPDFIFGFTNDFSYKNFDLNVFLQGSQGNDILSYTLLELETISGINNATTEALKRWTPSNTNTDVPKAFAGRPQRVSS
ncbi:TonB-dependent receptor, partial [Daejeonella sp.]|uniref:SusC/RagA family TonB-linked outer membrane protein n=1 Tax=Daejeonella sp. TaxID=2805397 RepID=UPI0030BA486D